MWPPIARHIICPLHERLIGRRTFAYLRELERSQWAAPDDLREMQREKLRALLVHADDRTPFYRRRFAEAGVDVRRDDPWDVLHSLPLLQKEDIRRSLDDMIWRDAPGGLIRYHTGGSSGEPLLFYFDRRRPAYDQAARIRSHRWFGVDIGDRELFLWGSPIEAARTDRVKRFRDALFNQRLLSAFEMSAARMDQYLGECVRYQPACLFGYPSSIALLVEHARARGRTMPLRSLRAVFATGEVCFPHQREAIASFFGVPVADGYGSREAGFLAHECPEGCLHITAESVIVEVVDDVGDPVPVGETGDIIVTHLDTFGMPFIRYRTGDIGRLRPGRCACGRGLPLMDVVQGRTTDFLYLPDGNIRHALSIIYPLRELSGVRQFRVTQQKDFRIVVDVVADDSRERITHEAVLRSVRPVVGDQIDVCVEFVERIASVGSGKFRYVVSHAIPPTRVDVPQAGSREDA